MKGCNTLRVHRFWSTTCPSVIHADIVKHHRRDIDAENADVLGPRTRLLSRNGY
jgi:hypothetical protein